MKTDDIKKPILVTRSSLPSMDEYINEITDIWDTAWLTNMGTKHQKLTALLEKKLEIPYVSLFTNGHMALEFTLQALNLSGEVITTPYSFASTTHAIVRNGLTPVFCDIDPNTYTIDANKIEDLITEKTTAIVPVHVYGNICDIEKIQAIADKYHLKVVYDAAHAFNETYQGISTAAFGDASMFSFHATKVFNTIEGGAITTQNAQLYESINKLKNFGIKNEEIVDAVGGNAKMNEFQAAMGICNLRHLEQEITLRGQAFKRYTDRLKNVSGLKIPKIQKNVTPNYAYYPVIFDSDILGVTRNQICEKLKEHNIYSRKYFYPLINDFDCYKNSFNSANTPIAKKISESVLTLPMYAGLSDQVVDKICHIILEAIK